MPETDKLILEANNHPDFETILCKVPSLFPNVECLIICGPVNSCDSLPKLQNLNYLKALRGVGFLLSDKLSLPGVTRFACFDDSVKNIINLAEDLPRIFPNLQFINLSCFDRYIPHDCYFNLPPHCDTVMGTSDVIVLFAKCESVKNLAVDEIYPGDMTKQLLTFNSDLKTLIVNFTATLNEIWTDLVPAILQRFQNLEFLEIRTVRATVSCLFNVTKVNLHFL